MSDRPSPDLDTFEVLLLTELRAVVEQQAAAARPAPSAQPARVRRHRRRTWYVSLAGAAAATVAIALLLTVARPTPGYAVSGRDGQEITVTVTRLEGAGALEEALRERGVAADITYLPTGTACRDGRYDEVDAPGLALSVGADLFEVTIPPGSVGRGETFVLSAAVTPLDDGTGAHVVVGYGIAAGPVAPCTTVAAS